MNETSLGNLSLEQLRRAVQLREQIESLQSQLNSLVGGRPATPTSAKPAAGKGRRTMSPAARARIAAAQRARWAKLRGGKGGAARSAAAKPGGPRKRKMSAEARARLAALARARWAKVRAAGRSRL